MKRARLVCGTCGRPGAGATCARCRRARRAAKDATQRALPWDHVYRTAEWRAARRAVLARDPVCVLCGAAPATVADHIIPLRALWTIAGWTRSPYDIDNLRGICARCNGRRTPYGRTE